MPLVVYNGALLLAGPRAGPLPAPALASDPNCCCECKFLCFEKVYGLTYVSTDDQEDDCATSQVSPIPAQPAGVLIVIGHDGDCVPEAKCANADLPALKQFPGGECCPEVVRPVLLPPPAKYYTQFYYRVRAVTQCSECCNTFGPTDELCDVPGFECIEGVDAQGCGSWYAYAADAALIRDCAEEMGIDLCIDTYPEWTDEDCENPLP